MPSLLAKGSQIDSRWVLMNLTRSQVKRRVFSAERARASPAGRQDHLHTELSSHCPIAADRQITSYLKQ